MEEGKGCKTGGIEGEGINKVWVGGGGGNV
jgi:hypothetical protein